MAEIIRTKDLLGVEPIDLPHFAELLQTTSRGMRRRSVPHEVALEERHVTAKALAPFQRVVEGAGFEPLLMELAIIEDRQHYGPSIHRKRTPEFLSLICAFPDEQRSPSILRAWHLALELVINPPDKSKPAPIVPHPGTYGDGTEDRPFTAYLTDSFSDYVDRLVTELPRLAGTAKGPLRIATAQADLARSLVRGREALLEWAYASSEDCRIVRPATMANRYEYKELYPDDVGAVGDTVQQLIGHFTSKVIALGGSGDCSYFDALVQYLKSCHMLIVPFLRPRTESLSGYGHTRHAPGGCIFLIVKGEHGPATVDTRLERLALNVGSLLSRAALLEAHSEFEIILQRQKTIAIWSHTLYSEAAEAQERVQTVLSKIETGQEIPDCGEDDLRHARDGVKRFQSLMYFAVEAQKSLDGEKARVLPEERGNLAELQDHLQGLVSQTWNRLLSRGTNIKDWFGIESPEIKLPDPCDGFEFHYNEDQSWIVVFELIKNVLQHGNPSAKGVHIELQTRTDVGSGRQEAIFVVTNEVPESGYAKAEEAEKGSLRKLGLSSLDHASRACGFANPSVVFKEPRFIHEVVVGVTR